MSGRELCAAFYRDAVAPLLADVPHSAGLLGPGSEVLGFDDPTSTDHHWGPRALVFVDEANIGRAPELTERLAQTLPVRFGGFSTNFLPPDPNDHGTMQLADIDEGPVNHRVEIHTIAGWTKAYLGFDAREPALLHDWLSTSSQRLATVVDAAVFHDGLGELAPLQDRLRWYPDDLWRYVLAVQWRRISQEDHFVGRTAQVGDELGSRLLAGRLARDLMRLAFLLERRHAPYIKWFGSAFRRLPMAAQLGPPIDAAVAAPTFAEREAALAKAYEVALAATAALGLGDDFEPRVKAFYGRGFLVTFGERVAGALLARIADPDVRALDPGLGAVDQFADSTDVLSSATRCRGLFAK